MLNWTHGGETVFTFATEQKVCSICGIRVGGQPGENPPLLISSMFHKGDRLLESRSQRKFDRVRAADLIKRQEELSQSTGIPAIVAMVANSADEMKCYIDFFTGVSDRPFAIDIWVAKTRIEAARYVAGLGLQDRLLYNSITPWDKEIPEQVAELKSLGIKHVVLQAFDEADQMPGGRATSLRRLLDQVGEDTFESILVDTSVMNLPAIGFSSVASRLIKERFGWPAGAAPSNGTHMWKEAREMWGREGFAGLDAAAQGISSLLWSDFVFYGPIATAPRVIPAVLGATLVLSTLVYSETGRLPASSAHPIYRFFGDFARRLEQQAAG